MLAAMRPAEHLSHQNHQLPQHAADSHSTQPARQGKASIASPMKKEGATKPKGSLQRQRKDQTVPDSSKSTADAAASRGKEVAQQVQQKVPGLLTLSRPIEESTDAAASTSSRSKAKKKAGQNGNTASGSNGKGSQPRKKKGAATGTAGDDRQPPSPSMLSKSAPVSASNLAAKSSENDGWKKAIGGEEGGSSTESSALTWQQQLMAGDARNSPSPSTKKGSKGASKKSRNATPAAPAAQEKDSLTWQQALMGSGKPRGPTFDVFADARDAATFGSSGASTPTGMPPHGGPGYVAGHKKTVAAKGRRQRSDSLGEASMLGVHHNGDHKRGASTGAAVQLGAKAAASADNPSTPNKLAYAGPNFHNSPSPASLPMPKFNKGARTPNEAKGTVPSHLREVGDASSSSSSNESDEDESILVDQARYRREQTAPAEMTAQSSYPASSLGQPPLPQQQRAQTNADVDTPDRSVTIETLLAKMRMLPSSSSTSSLPQ